MLKVFRDETGAVDQLPPQVILVQNVFEELRQVLPN